MSTICAISTAQAVGGISLIRISGKKAVSIADKLFVSFDGKLQSACTEQMHFHNNFLSYFTNSLKMPCMISTQSSISSAIECSYGP